MKKINWTFILGFLFIVSFTLKFCKGGDDDPVGTYKDSYSNFMGTKFYRVLNIHPDGTWDHSIYEEGEKEISGISDGNGYNDSGKWSFKNEEFVSYGEVSSKKVLILTTTYGTSSKFFFIDDCLEHIPLTSKEKKDKKTRESVGVTWNHPTDKLFCLECDSYSLCK